jgi:RND family efflux transporter MFP subunit
MRMFFPVCDSSRVFKAVLAAILLVGVCVPAVPALAQARAPAAPPPLVSLAPVASGRIAPQTEFVGTVYFAEVSDVASEIEGIVDAVKIEDGQRVKAGQALVELNTDLLAKRLEATRSSHQQVLAELDVARLDLGRREALFRKGSIAEGNYDDSRFKARALERRADSLQAEVERLEIETRKTVIRAPYDGVVIRRSVSRGEWLAKGKPLAVLARDDVVDIVVEVPETAIGLIRPGVPARVSVGAEGFDGTVFAVVPRVNEATRTLPVKVRTANRKGLVEGQSATVTLPTAAARPALIVPRDAVISSAGRTVVFVVQDAKTRMVPVSVIGFDGLAAGVAGEGLSEGMQVVVKGNERLRDGQEVALSR